MEIQKQKSRTLRVQELGGFSFIDRKPVKHKLSYKKPQSLSVEALG